MCGFYISSCVTFQVVFQMSPMKGWLHGPRSYSDVYLGDPEHVQRGFLSPKSGAFAPFLLGAVSRVLGD